MSGRIVLVGYLFDGVLDIQMELVRHDLWRSG